LRKPNSVLEIGAGSATLSKELSTVIPAKYDIIEPGNQWRDYYKNIGLNYISSEFPCQLSKKYDLIVASHWLEHVIDLDSTINSLYESVNKGGIIFIEVPNCNKSYWIFNHNDIPHIQFFTEESLNTAFTNKGFSCLRIESFGLSWQERTLGKSVLNEENYFMTNPEGFFLRGCFIKN